MVPSTKSLPKTTFKCPFCFKIFDDGPALIKHLALHNLVERKENDKKSISSEASLPPCHVKLVRCDNIVQCSVKPEIPGISGDRKCGLKKPLKSFKIQTRNGGKLFRCTKCPKKYRSQWSLNVHFRSHTGAKPYRCTSCDLAFARSDRLKEDERIHAGENLYSCRFCSSSFTFHSNLLRHIRIHQGIKPFNCSQCGYKFSRKDHVKRHYIQFHKLTNLDVVNS